MPDADSRAAGAVRGVIVGRRSATRADGPRVGVGGVVDVAYAQEVGGGHDPELLVAHVADQALEGVGEVGEGDGVAADVELLEHSAAEGEERDRAAAFADDVQADLGEEGEELAVLVGGEGPGLWRGDVEPPEEFEDASHVASK